MKTIHTKHAPAAIGPYSQAILVGDTLYASGQAKQAGGFVFLSGQIGIDPTAGKIITSDIAGQTEQVCKNIKAILKKAETPMDNVVKTTCFLRDMKDFAAFNEVYAKHFPGKPARSCFAVKDLPAGALCEIEVIAVK